MGASIAAAISELLKLGNLTLEERHLYDDNVLKLTKEWYSEYDKLETDEGSDNRLDDITDELRITLDAVVKAVRAKNT